ncbi:MAG: glutaredoxin domain-containing protein [Candidatus Omnitrophica bacterium]|nr:glutaredoxin domain-containing protein [Candidatus Omnitrophota bacterium]
MSKIIVYGTPTCPYCTRAKEYFSNKNIDIEYIDVASNTSKGEEMVQKSGQMGVPVIDIDGSIIVGFDKEKIEETLKV